MAISGRYSIRLVLSVSDRCSNLPLRPSKQHSNPTEITHQSSQPLRPVYLYIYTTGCLVYYSHHLSPSQRMERGSSEKGGGRAVRARATKPSLSSLTTPVDCLLIQCVPFSQTHPPRLTHLYRYTPKPGWFVCSPSYG